MTIKVENILTSAHGEDERGKPLFTLQARYPNIIHGEVMTHRVFSRNASSNRAIPVEKMLADIERDPFIPTHWGSNQKGMQAGDPLSAATESHCRDVWMWAMDKALFAARCLIDNGLHKQIANRVLQPYGHMNVVITADEWENFDALRINGAAEPHMQDLAVAIKDARLSANVRSVLKFNDWHLPYIHQDDWDKVYPMEDYDDMNATLKLVSAARCARVSYLTHDGRRTTLEEDLELAKSLELNKHMSPFEHQATPDEMVTDAYTLSTDWARPWLHGNFTGGWCQQRKFME